MNRKNIPILLMLTAGAIICIITYVMKFSTLAKLVSLFTVLLIFWILGSILKWTLDYFDKQNEEKLNSEAQDEEQELEDVEGVAGAENA